MPLFFGAVCVSILFPDAVLSYLVLSMRKKNKIKQREMKDREQNNYYSSICGKIEMAI